MTNSKTRQSAHKLARQAESVAASAARTRPKIRDEDYRQLAEFRFAIRSFLEFSQNAAKQAGLTPQQHQALLTIRSLSSDAQEQISIGAIAAKLLVRHHSAVELVNRLVDLHLVTREVDANDRRRVQVALTAKAGKILESLSATHLEELRGLRPSLLSLLQSMDAQ